MSVKPIDLQTNMSQMHEVSKSEHARSMAAAEARHVLDEESDKKSRLVNSKLDELKKSETSTIREKEEKEARKGKKEAGSGNREKEEERKKNERSSDEKLGRFIDVLK